MTKKNRAPEEPSEPPERDEDEEQELQDEDFQFVLSQLLGAYQPILEEDLARSRDPEQLRKDVRENPPDCEAEFALADRLFDKFFTEEVALRLLPPQGRELLGPIAQWRWCMLHLRCCIIFGWLVCRGPRTFRGFIYYLFRYWLCVRRALGTPVQLPLTGEAQQDFEGLVQAFARAYQPYLTDQLATVEFPLGLTDDLQSGKLDCFEGEQEAAAVFERFLSADIAQALLGREAFERHSQHASFWFCRCWCLCAIRFGCCLARARNFIDIFRCLRFYRRCLRECFRPLFCELTQPQECVAEEVNTTLNAMVVAVMGSAGGSGFSHYILEWSKDNVTWNTSNFHYPPIPPGGGTQGNSPVSSGLLGYFDTTPLDAGHYFLRLTVFSVQGTTCVRLIDFSLFKQDVRILGVSSYFNLDTTAADPAARFVENVPALCTRPAGTFEVSFGECLSVLGSAFVGGCEQQKIKRYTIDYKPGFETNCSTPGWTNVWTVEYDTIWQYRDMNMRKDTSVLTSVWVEDCVVPVSFPPYCLLKVPQARLQPSCWQSRSAPPSVDCQLSGLFTLRLVVEDTDGNRYCDTQRVWIDNKRICGMIRIDAVPKCADLNISDFASPPDCSIPWVLPVSGIAYDEYIDPLLPATRPNDNFDQYFVRVTKQGGPQIQIPVDGPTGTCFFGTERVGNPGTTCAPPCDPFNPAPGAVFGTLAQFDLRAVDPLCKAQVSYPVPDAFTIPRGECCVYTFKVWVYDRTLRGAQAHHAEAEWPVKICNDLRP